MKIRVFWGLCLFALLPAAQEASAITVGEVDDFSTGVDNWTQGPGAAPNAVSQVIVQMPGSSRSYMQVQSFGSGASANMFVFNEDQWAGDYIDVGVIAIEMEVMTESAPSALALRLAFGTNVDPTQGRWLSTKQSFSIAPGAPWQTIRFAIETADLMSVRGSATYANTMNDVAALRLLHNTAAANQGLPVAATLLVDNIRAIGRIGDFDQDGDVDGADLVKWRMEFRLTDEADADLDGDSDGHDFLLWQRNVGAGVGAAVGVPEPHTLATLLLAAVALVRSRDRW